MKLIILFLLLGLSSISLGLSYGDYYIHIYDQKTDIHFIENISVNDLHFQIFPFSETKRNYLYMLGRKDAPILINNYEILWLVNCETMPKSNSFCQNIYSLEQQAQNLNTISLNFINNKDVFFWVVKIYSIYIIVWFIFSFLVLLPWFLHSTMRKYRKIMTIILFALFLWTEISAYVFDYHILSNLSTGLIVYSIFTLTILILNFISYILYIHKNSAWNSNNLDEKID